MSEGIYLERDGELVPMTSTPYDSEAVLQELLEQHTPLLAGDQLTPNREPRRFALVRREAGVPDSPAGADRWSMDHLFVDQDGMPTLVEVKQSNDTRIRREVVGQMLDYAANAVVYWPPDHIRSEFESTHANRLGGHDGVLLELLDLSKDELRRADERIEQFWQQVASNLRAGRIRLLFIADELPSELRRIIEFLNEQMSPAVVLGIEIRNYEGNGLRALVPRVTGMTETASSVKDPASQISLDELFDTASVEVRRARELLDAWADSRGLRTRDRGKSRRYSLDGTSSGAIYLYPTYEAAYIMLKLLDDATAASLASTIAELKGVESAGVKEPGIPCNLLIARWKEVRESVLEPFVEAVGASGVS
jgi:hypothetical protein